MLPASELQGERRDTAERRIDSFQELQGVKMRQKSQRRFSCVSQRQPNMFYFVYSYYLPFFLGSNLSWSQLPSGTPTSELIQSLLLTKSGFKPARYSSLATAHPPSQPSHGALCFNASTRGGGGDIPHHRNRQNRNRVSVVRAHEGFACHA